MGLSLAERDRRYAAIRELMKKDGIDCLVIASRDTYFTRGNVRYVTNHCNYLGEELVLFTIEEEPSIITVGAKEEAVRRGGWIHNFIGITTLSEQAEQLKQELSKYDRGNKIGIVGMTYISFPMGSVVQAQCPNRVVDADWLLEQARSLKSPEEIEILRISASIADKTYTVIKDTLQPGLSDNKVYAEAKRIIHEMGCEYSMEFMGIHSLRVSYPWGDVMEANDRVCFDLTPSYLGYYTQLLMTVPVGKYPHDVEKLVPVWEEALATGVDILRTGATVGAVDKAISAVIRERGYEPFSSRCGHSIGLDVNDGQLISSDNTTEIKPGMTFALHPFLCLSAEHANKFIHGGYTYLVTDTGVEKINKINYFNH